MVRMMTRTVLPWLLLAVLASFGAGCGDNGTGIEWCDRRDVGVEVFRDDGGDYLTGELKFYRETLGVPCERTEVKDVIVTFGSVSRAWTRETWVCRPCRRSDHQGKF